MLGEVAMMVSVAGTLAGRVNSRLQILEERDGRARQVGADAIRLHGRTGRVDQRALAGDGIPGKPFHAGPARALEIDQAERIKAVGFHQDVEHDVRGALADIGQAQHQVGVGRGCTGGYDKAVVAIDPHPIIAAVELQVGHGLEGQVVGIARRIKAGNRKDRFVGEIAGVGRGHIVINHRGHIRAEGVGGDDGVADRQRACQLSIGPGDVIGQRGGFGRLHDAHIESRQLRASSPAGPGWPGAARRYWRSWC